MDENPGDKRGPSGLRSKRSRTLRQLSLLIISIYIFAGLATYLVYSGSQNRLLERSREKIVQMHASTVYGNAGYAVDFLLDLGKDRLSGLTSQQLLLPEPQGAPLEARQYLQKMLSAMIDAWCSGLQKAVILLPASSAENADQVIAAAGFSPSQPPLDTLLRAAGAGKPWSWTDSEYVETPEGRNLVIAKEIDLSGGGLRAYFVAVRPMEDEVSSIQGFFDQRGGRSRRNLALADLAAVAFMSLLTYIFLGALVRRRITRPIEELHHAAAEVMSGNLDMEVPVRKGEEFAGLKSAFNTLVANLRAIITMPAVGERPFAAGEPTGEEPKSGEPGPTTRRKGGRTMAARSRTLYYTGLFVTVIFLAFAVAGFLAYNHWQNGLIEDSVQETVRGISGYFGNDSAFIRYTLDEMITEKLLSEGMESLSLDQQFFMIEQKQVSSYQRFYNQFCGELVAKGVMGLEAVMVILAGPGIPGGSTVVVSNDESQVYDWEVPAFLLDAIENGTPSLYFQNGIPELGLEGEQFVGIETFPILNLKQAYVGVRSLRGEVGEIRDFYAEERGEVFAKYVPMVMGFLAAFLLLILLGLGFLVRRNITHPVEELSAAAEKVMQGDLDVDIPVREGEDVAVLQRAFRELVESFRKIVSRSTEG